LRLAKNIKNFGESEVGDTTKSTAQNPNSWCERVLRKGDMMIESSLLGSML